MHSEFPKRFGALREKLTCLMNIIGTFPCRKSYLPKQGYFLILLKPVTENLSNGSIMKSDKKNRK